MPENSPNKYAALLLLLHQPYRVTDTTQFEVNSLEELFAGKYNKAGFEASNQTIFERIAQNCYLPAGEFWVRYLEKNPEFRVNFTFSGTFLDQCEEYPRYGRQVIELYQRLAKTGQVGIAGENYYHGVSHYYSWEEFARQIQEHRVRIKELFGVWPTYFRNTEGQLNNEIVEFVRLMGFEATGMAGLYRHLRPGELPVIKRIERPRFDREAARAAVEQNEREYTPRYMAVAPLDRDLSATIFHLQRLNKIEEEFRQRIRRSDWGFHLLFNDYEALGEHNSEDEDDVYAAMEKFISIFQEEGIKFLGLEDIPEKADFEARPYHIPFDVATGNHNQDLESWRGNYFQEKAFVALSYLHDAASKLYDLEDPEAKRLLKAYRRLTTSDHFYYLPDIPGEVGEVHLMFSPYNSQRDAYDSYLYALEFVQHEVQKYLAANQRRRKDD